MLFPEICVLGATGRIGQVLQYCWNSAGNREILWQARRPQPADDRNWVVLDPLSDPDALAAATRGRDAVLCLSGITNDRCAADGAADLGDNARLALAAIRAVAGTGARVLLASSAAVYGNQPGPLSETTALCPANAYGRAKAEMEAQAAALGAELGVPVTSLRIGNIAGLDAILGGWRTGFELDVFDDGRSPRRSYIGVQSLARALTAVLRAPRLPGTLNIAAPGMIEMGELLDAAGLHWTPRPAPGSAIATVQLDVTALSRISPLPAVASGPGQMVAEWRALEPHVNKERNLP